jgi:2Fe-2S iron-sulfur cluster binding domain
VVGPTGDEAASVQVIAGYESNLRTMLVSNNLRLYDDRTARFDSPYQTGSCGGEGTCGTCVVSVLGGKELLNERMRVEDKALRKQLSPPNYRWSCRTRVGVDPAVGGEVIIKLRPQTATW